MRIGTHEDFELHAEWQGTRWQIIDSNGNDTEISGRTLPEAIRNAKAAWDGWAVNWLFGGGK